MSELALQPLAEGNPVAPLLVDLLTRASIEVAAGSRTALAHLREYFDPGTEVFVNFLPGGDWRPVADTAMALHRAGFVPVPHIAARSVADAAELEAFLSRLAEAHVTRVLLIAGDQQRPAGPYASSL